MKRTAMRALFAAAAVVAGLSLASCSGDLHEELAKEVIETDAYTPSIASEDEISFFYKTSEQDDYYVWAWDGTNGGDYFTGASWPGAAMELMGSDDDGAYIYKYVFSVTTAPAQLIISHGAEVKIYDGAAYVNHGLYDGGDTPTVINKIATEEAATPAAPSAGSTETPASGSGDGTTETPSSGSEPAETPSTGGGTGSENAGSEEASSGTEEGGPAETPAENTGSSEEDDGSSTESEENVISLEGFKIIGAFSEAGIDLTSNGDGTYSYTCAYAATMTDWGSGASYPQFKLTDNTSWYGHGVIVAGTFPDGITLSGDNNSCIGPLTAETTYVLTFTPHATTITLDISIQGEAE